MERKYHITPENAREMQLRGAAKKKENRIFQTEALKHAKEIAAGLRVLAKNASAGDRAALADLYRYTGEDRQQIDITSNGDKVTGIALLVPADLIEDAEAGPDE